MKDNKLRKALNVKEDSCGNLFANRDDANNAYRWYRELEEKVNLLEQYLGIHIRVDYPTNGRALSTASYGYCGNDYKRYVKNDKHNK